MRVLVVGGGGREHALCWKIAQSPLCELLLCAPGNAGTSDVARNVDVAANDVAGLVALAKEERIDLVVVGPEEPLCLGLADKLRAEGIDAFGPGAAGARLEGSKVFTKEILDRHRIPTGAWKRFDRAGAAKTYLHSLKTWPQVVKADGLAAGKGVAVCKDVTSACAFVDQVMEERRLGDAGNTVVVEEFLGGHELSVMAITDGETLLVMEGIVDHKQVGEGDTGANTGGMGVVTPVPWVTRRLMRQVEQRVLIPVLHALQIEEIPFRGVLYAGLMVDDTGPRVLEFNVRFGDPETQVVVRRFKSDLLPYLVAAARGELSKCEPPDWESGTSIGVIGAAEGYPGEYRRGDPITGLDAAARVDGAVVFQGGTVRKNRGFGPQVFTNGGRVVCATALGTGLTQARERAYDALDRVVWDGKFCRRDIGLRDAPRIADSER
jgi:phosphoribosylamine--glycine ligase